MWCKLRHLLSMRFSDQIHINRVRDALWKPAEGASVMVGAGFSINARPKRPLDESPPTWEGLAESLFQRLHPKDQGTPGSGCAVTKETSGVLRLAQEYESAHGRPELHRCLLALVRDDDFVPGDMHQRLLNLPWRDVFTTNWDTLLERTSQTIAAYSYSFVRCQEDIPLAARPRVVKLHGSVDARFPLICTEEDYRTYPTCFAPFVNTVQQTMMETLLFLIGFSGDDPNFLRWSGWIRDNLGPSAPKIYLAGWLDLPFNRRRMLEDRNIVPIDLAGHPNADAWRRQPERVRHAHATDWILRSLDYGEPYDIANWPLPAHQPLEEIPAHLRPLPRRRTKAPKEEPKLDSTEGSSEDGNVAAVRSLIAVWSHNRRQTYPGWLSVPSPVRLRMHSTRERAASVLDTLPHMEMLEQLRAAFELIWRWEIQLEPLSEHEATSSRLAEAASRIAAQVEGLLQGIGAESVPDAEWTETVEYWAALVLALAAAARFRFDGDEFNQRLSAVSEFQFSSREISHRIWHERCLWAVYALDFESLESLLEKWRTEDCDPIWMTRKAALLFEIGFDGEAQDLNQKALHATRAVPDSAADVSAKSREAWALLCAGATTGIDKYWRTVMESHRRWAELTRFHCNAGLEMQSLNRTIGGEESLEKGSHFDLEKVWMPGWSFSQAEYLTWSASHRALRLTEICGLPPVAGNTVVAGQVMELAARQLWRHEPELSARVLLRVAKNESRGALNFVLSRARVASMPDDVLRRLADDAMGAIEFMLSRIAVVRIRGRGHWAKRLPVLLEALSRFVLGLDSEKVNSVLTSALRWYANGDVTAVHQNSEPLRNLLSRTWEALPQARRTERVADLFEAPIVGLDGFEAGVASQDGTRVFEKHYPDPCEVLGGRGRIEGKEPALTPTRRSDIVDLLARGMKGGGEARRRAAGRVDHLADILDLSTDEISMLGLALWGEDYESHGELPSGTDFLDWAFLALPEPIQAVAAKRFRGKWLGGDGRAGTAHLEPVEILWQVGAAVLNMKIRGAPLSISMGERSFLCKQMEQWIDEPIPVPVPGVAEESDAIFPEGSDEKVRRTVEGLANVLLEIGVPEELARRLYDKVRCLNESEMPARRTYAGLIRALPDLLDDIGQELEIALASDLKRTASDAARGLHFWLRASIDESEGVCSPPESLVRETGLIIASRRKAALGGALQVAELIFSAGTSEQQNLIGGLAVEGLGALAKELRYGANQIGDINVPFLRWRCSQLAIVMDEKGYGDNSAVVHWKEESDSDPLPELKQASDGKRKNRKPS